MIPERSQSTTSAETIRGASEQLSSIISAPEIKSPSRTQISVTLYQRCSPNQRDTTAMELTLRIPIHGRCSASDRISGQLAPRTEAPSGEGTCVVSRPQWARVGGDATQGAVLTTRKQRKKGKWPKYKNFRLYWYFFLGIWIVFGYFSSRTSHNSNVTTKHRSHPPPPDLGGKCWDFTCQRMPSSHPWGPSTQPAVLPRAADEG